MPLRKRCGRVREEIIPREEGLSKKIEFNRMATAELEEVLRGVQALSGVLVATDLPVSPSSACLS